MQNLAVRKENLRRCRDRKAIAKKLRAYKAYPASFAEKSKERPMQHNEQHYADRNED